MRRWIEEGKEAVYLQKKKTTKDDVTGAGVFLLGGWVRLSHKVQKQLKAKQWMFSLYLYIPHIIINNHLLILKVISV